MVQDMAVTRRACLVALLLFPFFGCKTRYRDCVDRIDDFYFLPLTPAPEATWARSTAELERGEHPRCPDGTYNAATDVIVDCYPPSYCDAPLMDCGSYQCWYCIDEQELRDWAAESLTDAEIACVDEDTPGGLRVCDVVCKAPLEWR